MAKNSKGNMLGSWAFLIGVVLAVILGALGQINPMIAWVLVAIGLVVGLLNVADEEATPFLMSGAVLIIASGLGQGLVGIQLVDDILSALLLIFVPATIIVAIRNVFTIARK